MWVGKTGTQNEERKMTKKKLYPRSEHSEMGYTLTTDQCKAKTMEKKKWSSLKNVRKVGCSPGRQHIDRTWGRVCRQGELA